MYDNFINNKEQGLTYKEFKKDSVSLYASGNECVVVIVLSTDDNEYIGSFIEIKLKNNNNVSPDGHIKKILNTNDGKYADMITDLKVNGFIESTTLYFYKEKQSHTNYFINFLNSCFINLNDNNVKQVIAKIVVQDEDLWNKAVDDAKRAIAEIVVQDKNIWDQVVDDVKQAIAEIVVQDKNIWDQVVDDVKQAIAYIALNNISVWNTLTYSILPEIVKIAKKLLEENNRNIQTYLIKNDFLNRKFYEQKIYFGSPGVGKSYKIQEKIQSKDVLYKRIVFHPNYTHNDYSVKILPKTQNDNVTYETITGDFFDVLTKAFSEIYNYIYGNSNYIKKCIFIIEELNRGNVAEIFGNFIQLLDRNFYGNSLYPISINDYEKEHLKSQLKKILKAQQNKYKNDISDEKIYDFFKNYIGCDFKNNEIVIPFNLSIYATINSSDDSVFFMDSAFKRRWDWEYIPNVRKTGWIIEGGIEWDNIVENINKKLKEKSDFIRNIEDKLIGYYFVLPDRYDDKPIILKDTIKNKLMFYLWDSVFGNNKELIKETFNLDGDIKTFEDFINKNNYEKFIKSVKGTDDK